MTPLRKTADRLAWLLRLHSKSGVKVRRMEFTALPLTTTLKFEGVPLRALMSPPVPEDGFECEQILDTWLSPIITGDGDSVRDLTELAGEDMLRFMACRGALESVSLHEMTVLLIYALGNGAEMSYGPDHIMVTRGSRTFGITNGIVTSRFCDGMSVGAVNPQELLERTRTVRTQDVDFCKLYREACRRGKGAREALIAIYTGQPSFSFRKMGERSVQVKPPSRTRLNAWERILFEARDPIAKLYKQLVPKWMTTGEFSTVFTPLSSRPLEPGPQLQQLCVTKLHTYFHNKNKKD